MSMRYVLTATVTIALTLVAGCEKAEPTSTPAPPTATASPQAHFSTPLPSTDTPQPTLTPLPTPHPILGTVTGRIGLPREHAPAMDLFFENSATEEIVIVPLAPGQNAYTATLPPGAYYAYAWLPDFSERGAFTSPEVDAFQPITVTVGKTVSGVDIDDWVAPEGPPIVLTGTLIDGTGADPVPDAALVIRDKRIVAAGPRSEVAIPPDAQHIDLQQATLLPGFINAHVHNAYVAQNLKTWAQAGVTTVRDLGAPVVRPHFVTRDRLRADPRNARLIAAGPLVTVPGGYPIAGNGFPSLTVTSPEDARQKINQLLDDGADVIKMVLESDAGPILSPEEAAAIVETAHQRDIPVTVHVTRLSDLQRALDAGVDDIAHIVIDRVPEEVIRHMVEADVYWVPTLEALRSRGADNLRRFVEAGGKVVLGNDAGYLRGLEIGMPMREIEQMSRAGMTPMQIIVAATRNAAHVCNREGALGTLQVGKIADVLVVNGDPLQDLRALQDVRLVIHEGVIIYAAEESERTNTVLIVFGNRFMPDIYRGLSSAFERAGYDIVIASDTLSPLRAYQAELEVEADILLEDVRVEDYDAIIFSCDMDIADGTARPETNRLAQEAVAQGKVLAAICKAPMLLGFAGVVDGVKVTGVPDTTCRILAEHFGAICTQTLVQRDGLIITGRDRGATASLARTVLQALREN